MYEFIVNFADLNIKAKTIYDFSYNLCKDYLSNDEPDFCVETNDLLIDNEVEISPYSPKRDYAESICLYREIADNLPLYNRMVFHGAVISYKGIGIVFTAQSGTGKTTHVRLWQKYLGDNNVTIVNGDKPIFNLNNDKVIAYSTPYAGKEGYQNHSSVELKAICFIRRAKENKITRVNAATILNDVFNQIYRPNNKEALVKTLDLLDKLLKLPVYVLECDMSEQAVKTSFEALTGLDFDNEKL